MGVLEDIVTSRRAGVMRCRVSSRTSPSLAELAEEFGLGGDPASYMEIGSDAARRLLRTILGRDLAHQAEIMPHDRATALAQGFLALFGRDGARFHTNATFDEVSGTHLVTITGWSPLTSATFDAGALVLGPRDCGCLWIEDED